MYVCVYVCIYIYIYIYICVCVCVCVCVCKKFTGVVPDNPDTKTRSFRHHADILCCEFPVVCVVLTYVVKYLLPFIAIIVRFRRHVSVIVSVLHKRSLCLVTPRLALSFRSRFVVGDTVCVCVVWFGTEYMLTVFTV